VIKRRTAAIVTAATGIASILFFGPSAVAQWSPIAGAEFAPWDSSAQTRAAELALRVRDPGNALRYGKRALEAMPYNPLGLSLMASTASSGSKLDALNLSAAMGWRDPITNLRLVEAALQEDQPVIAAQRIDALGRTSGPGLAAPLADRLLAHPGGLAALAERADARASIDWWTSYFVSPAATPEILKRRRDLIRAFDRSDRPWLSAIVGTANSVDGSPQGLVTGYELWRDTLADPTAFDGLIYDGKFRDFDPDAPQVGGIWALHPDQAATVERIGEGIILMSNRRGSGGVIGQTVPAPDGPRILRVSGKVTGGDPESFKWSAQCLGGAGNITLERIGAGSGPVGSFRLIPSPDCRMVYLALNNGPRATTQSRLELTQLAL